MPTLHKSKIGLIITSGILASLLLAFNEAYAYGGYYPPSPLPENNPVLSSNSGAISTDTSSVTIEFDSSVTTECQQVVNNNLDGKTFYISPGSQQQKINPMASTSLQSSVGLIFACQRPAADAAASAVTCSQSDGPCQVTFR